MFQTALDGAKALHNIEDLSEDMTIGIENLVRKPWAALHKSDLRGEWLVGARQGLLSVAIDKAVASTKLFEAICQASKDEDEHLSGLSCKSCEKPGTEAVIRLNGN